MIEKERGVTNSLESTPPHADETLVSPWKGGEVEAHGLTDPGMVRESNQDNFIINYDLGLYLVADGMGGRAGGEVASHLAVTSIAENVDENLEQLTQAELGTRRILLSQAVNFASLKIYERSLELPQYRGMGTTATLLWIPPPSSRNRPHSNVCVVAHVGDSRCYLLRAGLLYQVTEDHSLVNEQVKAGVLKRNDPLVSQIRNVITRCVGYQEEEEVDTFTLELFENDRFLLCSDGLTNKVKDIELAEKLGSDDLQKIPFDLVNIANERGGEDNITVIVAVVK